MGIWSLWRLGYILGTASVSTFSVVGYTLPCPTPYFPKYTLEFINKSECFNVRNNLESDFGPAQFITQLTHVLSVMEAVDASAILDFITH